MCGGRQAGTLSKLLRKRHPSTRYPLSPAQCANEKPPYGGDGRPGADEQGGRTRLSSQTLSGFCRWKTCVCHDCVHLLAQETVSISYGGRMCKRLNRILSLFAATLFNAVQV